MVGSNCENKRIVYTCGVWDLLHSGHIDFLKRAKLLGDFLIVGVEDDELVKQQKGVYPVFSCEQRIKMLEAIKYVDMAIPYYDFDYLTQAENVGADIFITSDSYRNSERFINIRNAKRVYFLPYNQSISTTQIKQKIKNEENIWEKIWEEVGMDNQKDDYEIVGHSLEQTKLLAKFLVSFLNIGKEDVVLDYGCGTGVLLKEIDCKLKIGIDVASSLIKRAIKNNPDGIFITSGYLPYLRRVDHIICFEVLHYLPNHEKVREIVDRMKEIADKKVIIMELPDIQKKEERIAFRKKIGKKLYPPPLYFEKDFFIKRGFKILEDYPKISVNSPFAFGVFYEK